jgi:predicted homoserine dehydrogenase-like protein
MARDRAWRLAGIMTLNDTDSIGLASEDRPLRIGVIGTGFVSSHFVMALAKREDYRLGKVLTRRPLASCTGYPRTDALTDSLDELIEHSDIVFECTGDVGYAAASIERLLAAARPVVTLNAEFHATLGSHFVGRGIVTEAEGDQPGCIAALHEEAMALGFKPLVYGNMKGFLNKTPPPEDMKYWAEKQGCSVPMVTSFTDGTKVQIEQCLVANGLGAGIAKEELSGLPTDDLQFASQELGALAEKLGYPLSEYVLGRKLPHGVFVVARHDEEQRDALRYFKQGEGPYYLLAKNYIMVHLEVLKTIDRIRRGETRFLDNGAQPAISVAALAKRALKPGEIVERGCGSFDLRGICVNIADRPDHLPICLANDMRVKTAIEPGQMLTMADVELPDSEALTIWQSIEGKALAGKLRAS